MPEEPAREPERVPQNTFMLLMKRLAGQSNEEILAQYVSGPDDLERALEGLDESDLDAAREPGKWTIRQIVHHIVDGDDIWKACLKAALGNPGCVYHFDWYDQEPWVERLDYAGRAVGASLALFRANREHTVSLLRHLPDAWGRYAVVTWGHIPDGRRLTVSDMICTQTIHVPWHIDQIRATREVLGR
jgi:uncharacterized damage-inducible protein DinB